MADVEFKLGETKFSQLSYLEQLAVKERGRPQPDLNIENSGKSRGKNYKRLFNRKTYSRNSWICGCAAKQALFCFPCATFGSDVDASDDRVWKQTGVKDLTHLSEKIKRHEQSKAHINNQMKYALFGKVNVPAQLGKDFEKDNDEVAKNRYVLSKVIDCIKFYGAHEEDTLRGLLNFTGTLDTTFKEYVKSFKDPIQNDILEYILLVYREEMLREIDEAPFLALIAHEVVSVLPTTRIAIVVRYVTKSGEPVERFWGFTELDAGSVVKALGIILKDHKHKLISQSYDGVVSNEFHKLVKQQYKNAHFVHSYAHELNSVVTKACSVVDANVRIFFEDLRNIVEFFNGPPHRLLTLNQTAYRSILINTRTVNVVFENKNAFIECLKRLQARNLQRIFEDPNFTFWLRFFHFIMPHVDALHDEIHNKNIEPSYAIKDFELNIEAVRNKIDAIMKLDQQTTTPCLEICDVIINNVKERFAHAIHLEAARLLDPQKFNQCHHLFPHKTLEMTCKAYSDFFNKERLKSELCVLFSSTECRTLALQGASAFLQFITSNDLDEAMTETKKLLQILLTTPMITTEAGRKFSTLKLIKCALRGSMYRSQLTAITAISMEKTFISSVHNFNEKVIDTFAANKNSRVPLQFKDIKNNRARRANLQCLTKDVVEGSQRETTTIIEPTTATPKPKKVETPDRPDFVNIQMLHEANEEAEAEESDIKIEMDEMDIEEAALESITKEESDKDDMNGEATPSTSSHIEEPAQESSSSTATTAPRHPLQIFFDSMAHTVMSFPPPLAIRAKMEVLEVISKLELEMWNQSE